MISANLFIKKGTYSNSDAIENAIHYIFKLNSPYKFYYGAYPPTPENAIALFYQLRESFPQNTCEQPLQHFYITFYDLKDVRLINEFVDQIANLFLRCYPVCFALHDDTKHLHTHFVISTTSYIPDTIPLTRETLNTFISAMERLAYSYNISLKKVTKNV